MIDHDRFPSVSETLRLLGVEPRGRRSKCPIHQGDNPQAFSFDDDRGLWNCFRCGKGGDVIRLVELAQDVDFRGAIRFLGIEAAKPPAPDPAIERRERIRRKLTTCAKTEARRRRDEFLLRGRLEMVACDLLAVNSESEAGWILLADALTGVDALEHWLDSYDHKLSDDALVELPAAPLPRERSPETPARHCRCPD